MEKLYNKRKFIVIICIIAALVMVEAMDVHAAQKRKLTLTQAFSLSMSKSRDYKKVKNKILMKQVKYKEAVKSIALKKKNMSTFRWSPLLSFKFPEKATLTQEYEFMYKPLQIQSEISSFRHRLSDIEYEVTEKVSNLYTRIYTYQEKVKYGQQKLSLLSQNLNRNQAKLIIGEAKQNDVDKISSSIKKTEGVLASDMRAYEKNVSDLSDLMGADISGSYEFVNPYKEARISRSRLDGLINLALSKNQSLYEAKMTTRLAIISVNTNFDLMKRQYGNKMSYISSYVNRAKAGESIDNDAFKNAYDRFLVAIDAPWQGKKRILFIRIPKEWFKGSIDGVRYVEDDPYLLYSNVLDYQDALNEQNSLEKEITKSVEDGFENLVTAKNSYDSLDAEMKKAKADMEKAEILNKAGELEFEEYEEARENYEELQISVMEALELYTTLLYSYDRLTCGGITQLLRDGEISLEQGRQGESFVTEDMADEAYYYIVNKVEDNLFELGIHIPEDIGISITHFELWVDGVQVGERTEASKTIRHLALSLNNTRKVVIRLFENENIIADCEIDPQEYQGRLNISMANQEDNPSDGKKIASYKYTVNKKTSIITFKVTPEPGLGITGFRLVDENGTPIYSNDPIPINESLSYLSILAEDLSHITAQMYGEGDVKLYDGRLDIKTKEIYQKN